MGFTAVELMIAMLIVAILVAVLLPGYAQYRERQRVSQATQELVVMGTVIKSFQLDHNRYPDDLSEVQLATRLDPWGRTYAYLNISDAKNSGKARKRKNLTPINSDFDLYSVGRDGESSPPLGAKHSRDDVVRANDGRYHGLAAEFE
ncbi:MAG TPA: type II secretion system protein [Burkholderiales bacterium]